MSRSEKLQQIPVGVTLSVITAAAIIRDKDKLPVIAKDGSNGLNITFANHDNSLHLAKTYWTKHSDFVKLCSVASANPKEPIIPQLKGVRLWLCVKEVKKMQDGKEVESNTELFDIIRYEEPGNKPMISGDPEQHPKGLPLGVFIEYKQNPSNWVSAEEMGNVIEAIPTKEYSEEQIEMEDVVFGVDVTTGKAVNGDKKLEAMFPLITGVSPQKLTPEQQEKFNIGKEIIQKGESKEMTSLNEPNADPFTDLVEKQPKDDWDDL